MALPPDRASPAEVLCAILSPQELLDLARASAGSVLALPLDLFFPLKYLVWFQARGPYHDRGTPWVIREENQNYTGHSAYATKAQADEVAERLNS